jgi:peptidoglycan/xylan/chitin deacetylase (PgdA/CDA1 family)
MQTGADRLVWRLGADRLRILSYHGVCADDLADEPWMPAYFVTKSAFEAQLRYLRENATILSLRDAVARLRDGSLPPRSVCLTFDDGHANNLYAALPLLRKYNAPATIFLASAYMQSGELFPFLKLRLIKLLAAAASLNLAAATLPDYKTMTIDVVTEGVDHWFRRVRRYVTENQWNTLRPLREDELPAFDHQLIDFGAHTHTHCILSRESRERRHHEIRASILKVQEWSGKPVRLFSYPNGERGDFDQTDRNVLAAEGITAAVTGIPGANNHRADLLQLRRYPVGLYHHDAAFRAEVLGVRTAFQVARRLAG